MSNSNSAPHQLPSIETPRSLVLAATVPEHLIELRNLLKDAGLPEQERQADVSGRPKLITQESIGGWATLPDWLSKHPEAHLVLLLPLPTLAIARQLGKGIAPETALAEWLSSAQSELGLVRQNRRRVSLMFAEPALADPGLLLATLSQRIQLDLEEIQTDKRSPELPDMILRLIADNLILQSANARNVVAEFNATAIPLPATAAGRNPVVDQVFNEFQSAREAVPELHEEKNLLLQQMQQIQEELERIYLEESQNKKEQLELQHRLQAAEETIQALHNSKSWKITKPLRILLDLFSGDRKPA
jgi:hypothetical protein